MSKRDEKTAEAQEILKNARKTATPEHALRIEQSMNWFEHEAGRETREASRGMGRGL